MSAHLPLAIDTLADAHAVEHAARKRETPCGTGAMIWRVWGEGPPVVLVHGGSGSWAHWVRNIGPLVAIGRTVYACDLPGCGESASPPIGHDGDALPLWLEVGLQTLLGPEPFDLVGFSFGSMVSALYTSQYGARLRRLVLVGAPALSREPMRKVGLREWVRLPDGPERDAAFAHNLRALMVARAESVSDLSLTLYVESLTRDRLTKRRLAGTDIVLRTLPAIAAPVWGIWGAQDVLYTGRFDVIRAGLETAPAFRTLTLIPGAGHWVQFEEADAFNAALRACLDG